MAEGNGNGSGAGARYGTIASVGVLAAGVVASWVSLNVQVNSAVSQSSENATALRALKEQVDRVYGRVGDLDSRTTRQESALAEVETQFRAEGGYRNLMYQSSQGEIGQLWLKVFGQALAPPAELPVIAK